MTVTYIAATAPTPVTNNGITITNTAMNGGDTIIIASASLDTTIATPSGYTDIDRNVGTGPFLGFVTTKQAPGTVGSSSSDAGASVVLNPAVMGAGHKTSACEIVLRGANPAAPINAHAFNDPTTGGTSFAGPSVTTSVDNCQIVSVFTDKDSTNPLDITPPAGYTVRASGVFTTGSGKANCVIATRDAQGAAGNYGADTWTTDAIPGTVQIFTIAVSPAVTTQTIRPMGDVGSPSGVTGVTNNTAGQLYTNIDDASLNTSDWDEFIVTGDITHSLTSLADPGTHTGFSYVTVFGLGSGVTSASFTATLKQSTTTIESWSVTVTADGQVDTHALSSTNIANIVYTSGAATNMRIEYNLTAAS